MYFLIPVKMSKMTMTPVWSFSDPAILTPGSRRGTLGQFRQLKLYGSTEGQLPACSGMRWHS